MEIDISGCLLLGSLLLPRIYQIIGDKTHAIPFELLAAVKIKR